MPTATESVMSVIAIAGAVLIAFWVPGRGPAAEITASEPAATDPAAASAGTARPALAEE